MDYLVIFLAGLALGIFAGVNYMRIQMWKHGIAVEPATGAGLDRLAATRREPPPMPMPSVVPAEQGGIEYRFLGGVTGEEQA